MRYIKHIIVVILLFISIGFSFSVSAKDPYTVTFLYPNGTEIESQEVQEGDSAIPLTGNDTFRIGYDFVNWSESLVNIQSDLDVYAIYVPKQFTVVFINHDGTILSSEEIDFNTILMPEDPPEREGYIFSGWSGGELIVKDDLFFTAMFTLIEEEVPVEPDVILIEAVTILLREIVVDSYNNLLNADVRNPVLSEKIDLINRYTENSRIIFPKLIVEEEDGVTVKIHKDSILSALDKEVSFDINLDYIDILINPNNLVKVIDIGADNMIFKMNKSNLELSNLYAVDGKEGVAIGEPFEISFFYNLNNIFPIDVITEITVSPLNDNDLYGDSDPQDVFFVEYNEEDNSYKVITSYYNIDDKNFTMTLAKNTVIIPMELTDTPVIEPDVFSPMDYFRDLDEYLLYVIGFGSFAVVYGIVYVFEQLKQRRS